MQNLLGFLAPAIIYSYIFLLNVLLPGRWVTGYVTKVNSEEKLRYRLNGLLVLFTVLLTWFLLGYFGVLAWDWLYYVRWYALAGAFVFGVLFLALLHGVLVAAEVDRPVLVAFDRH